MVKGFSTRRACLGTARTGHVLLKRHIFSKTGGRTSHGLSIIINITNRSQLAKRACNLLLRRVAATSPPHSPALFTSPSRNPTACGILVLVPKWKWLRTVGRNFFFLLSSALLPTPLLSPTFSLTHAMASSYAYSTSSSSDLSTPRSISPASAASGRSSQSSISTKRMSISSRRISASNPMSTVDITTIAEAMKMANLDTLRGYATNHYGQVQQYSKTEYVPKGQAAGYQVLREPLWNKGKSKTCRPM